MGSFNAQADALQISLSGAYGWLACIGTLPGIILQTEDNLTYGASHRNGPGKGALRSERDGRTLSWRAPGSAQFGPPVDCYVDGDYVLVDGEEPGKYLRAKVKTAYLAATPREVPVYIQERWGFAGDIIAADALAGLVLDFEFWALNLGLNVLSNVRAWIDPATPYLQIAPDGGVLGTPTSEATSIQLAATLAPGATAKADARLTIPPGTAFNPRLNGRVYFRFDGP